MWFLYSLYFAIWSSLSMPVSKKLMQILHPILLLIVGNIIFLPLMLILVIITTGVPNTTQLFYILLIGSGVIDAIAFIASYWAIKTSPISLISPISSFNPIFTTFFAFIFLHETLNATKLLGILVIAFGAYLLNIADIKHGLLKPITVLLSNRGVQLFLLANLIWGLTPILQKQAIAQTSPSSPLFTSFTGNLILTLMVFPFSLKLFPSAKDKIKSNIKWIFLIAPFVILAQWASFSAFSLAPLGYVTAVFKLSALFTIVWGALFFHEKRIKERLLGASVMLIGTVLLIL